MAPQWLPRDLSGSSLRPDLRKASTTLCEMAVIALMSTIPNSTGAIFLAEVVCTTPLSARGAKRKHQNPENIRYTRLPFRSHLRATRYPLRQRALFLEGSRTGLEAACTTASLAPEAPRISRASSTSAHSPSCPRSRRPPRRGMTSQFKTTRVCHLNLKRISSGQGPARLPATLPINLLPDKTKSLP